MNRDTQMDDSEFNNKWCVWYHVDTQAWTPKNFKKLCTISKISEFWSMVDGLLNNKNILMEHIYIMREGINPVWEDTKNRNGGCWSIKVDLRESLTIFIKILAYIVGETSLFDENKKNISTHVMGVSFCSKNSFNAIIQIWNDDKNLNKTTLLHNEIAEPFVAEIIYRPHIPEYYI
jgi:hypothetical protein